MSYLIQKFWNEYIKLVSIEDKKQAISNQIKMLQLQKKSLSSKYSVVDTEQRKLSKMIEKL